MNWNTKQQLPNLYNREKNRLEKNEQSFRDLWDYNKRCNICVIGVLKKKRMKAELEKYSKEIMAANFRNLARDTDLRFKKLSEP